MMKRLTTIIGFVFLLAGNYIALGQTLSGQAVVPTSTSATVSFFISGTQGGNITYRVSETLAGLGTSATLIPGAPASTSSFYGETRTFEINPLLPNKLYYWDVYFTGSVITSRTGGSFTTLPATSLPGLTATSGYTSNTGFSVNFTATNGNITTEVKYGTSPSALTSTATGSAGSGNYSGFANVSGLQPNTKYYYKLEATNSNGTTSSQVFSTTTLTANSIAEFNFDNDRISSSGAYSFSNGGTFVADRNNVANKAIRLSNAPIGSNITTPNSKLSRSVSVWAKSNGYGNGKNYVFGYGSSNLSGGYGLYLNQVAGTNARSVVNSGNGDDVSFAFDPGSTWHHYVTVYDGTNAKIYIDGVLSVTQAVPNWDTQGGVVYLGGNPPGTYGSTTFTGDIDDFKMFNSAISAQEVVNLREFNKITFDAFPLISAVAANAISSNSAVIAYNVKYGNITSTVKYGTAANALTSSVIGVSGNDLNYANLNGNVALTSLLPGTKYYYQVEAINENGTTTATVGDFTTAASDLVAEFAFDNSRQSVAGAFTFATGTTTFTTDRFGTPNSAIKLTNAKVAATITGLPSGNAPRTVSTWVKFDSYITSNNGFNAPWGYGGPGDGYGLGIYVDRYNTASHTYMSYSDGGSSTQSPVVTNNSPLAWQHMVTTYDGADAKIYLNGVLVHTQALPNWNTLNNNNFVLGGRASNSYGPFDGAMDDLKIYNRSLTAQEVTNLYLTNSPTAEVAPILSAIQLSNLSPNSVTVNYKVSIGNITSVVKYGTSPNSLTNVLTGVAGASSTTIFLNGAVALPGLIVNTKYYYQVEATNEFGIKSSEILSFETTPSELLANFTFDQTLTSTNGAYTLSNVGNGAYITSRSGTGNALEMKGSKLSVNIPTLPLGLADRTVSAWFKMDSYTATNYPLVFSYGDALQYKTFGFYLNNVNRTFQGNGYDFFGTTATAVANQWYQVVVTLEAGVMKIYFNNQLVKTQAVPLLNTTKNVNLDLNIGPFTGGVDDVQIYDKALTVTEVSNLFTYNTIYLSGKPEIAALSLGAMSTTSASINYVVTSTAFTSLVKYGTAANNLSNSIVGTASSGYHKSGSVNVTGLTANTTYYYQVEVTNANGTTSSDVLSFTTNELNVVAKFKFDNNKTNTSGNITFGPGANTFVTGRDLTTQNGALRFQNDPINVALPGLPRGQAARSVSVWAKVDSYVDYGNVFIFGYGANTDAQNYALSIYRTGSNYNFINYVRGIDNLSSPAAAFPTSGDWHHYVTTFDAAKNAKLYVDGVQVASSTYYSWNTANSNFFLGGNAYGASNITGAVDDLVIYDRALTQQEVTNLFNNNTILPVTLISYTAKTQNNNAVLNWKTASELNNSHFVVEKSTDGTNFSEIAKVNAKSANGADYTYTDHNTNNGTNYYRLTQVDLDGKTTNLGVKAVNMSLSTDEVKVYPNPAIDVVNISFEAGVYAKATLLDINGRVISTSSIAKVQNMATIDLSKVAAGTYLVQLTGKNSKTIRKVIKR